MLPLLLLCFLLWLLPLLCLCVLLQRSLSNGSKTTSAVPTPARRPSTIGEGGAPPPPTPTRCLFTYLTVCVYLSHCVCLSVYLSVSISLSVNTNISILSICSCPDITFKNYTPHGDRPNGMTVEKWRQLQTTIGSQSSKYQLRVPYKPSICLLTSLGSTIIVDLEVCKFFLNILL